MNKVLKFCYINSRKIHTSVKISGGAEISLLNTITFNLAKLNLKKRTNTK